MKMMIICEKYSILLCELLHQHGKSTFFRIQVLGFWGKVGERYISWDMLACHTDIHRRLVCAFPAYGAQKRVRETPVTRYQIENHYLFMPRAHSISNKKFPFIMPSVKFAIPYWPEYRPPRYILIEHA